MFFCQPFSLSRNVADASYLQQVAESLMFLRLNVTPRLGKSPASGLLRYFDTTTRPQMKRFWMVLKPVRSLPTMPALRFI